jgi:pyruvate dehydrogenase E1 component
MFVEGESIFYYLTVMNENYPMPAMPEGAAEGILKGMYSLGAPPKPSKKKTPRVTLMGSGTILREVQAAADVLRDEFSVDTEVLSVTSYGELRREALEVERANLLHPERAAATPYVADFLQSRTGPFVAASDYMRSVPDQIRQWVPGRYVVLGTDGFGRSDARAALRGHFEVDRRFIVLAALRALADEGQIDTAVVTAAIARLGIDVNKPNPLTA